MPEKSWNLVTLPGKGTAVAIMGWTLNSAGGVGNTPVPVRPAYSGGVCLDLFTDVSPIYLDETHEPGGRKIGDQEGRLPGCGVSELRLCRQLGARDAPVQRSRPSWVG